MKTMILKTASLFLVFGFFLTFQNSNAQEKKLTRQELKEVRKAQMVINFHILDTLLNRRTFVLEANYLQNKYGQRLPVVSSLNFIKVDGSRGILQTGANSGSGYNGVGGVTAEGTVGIWDLSKDADKLYFTLHFSLLTNLGNYDIWMTVSSDAHASATITGLEPGKLTWDGQLNTIYNSRVFKGQETY
jgi:hypothetical protein